MAFFLAELLFLLVLTGAGQATFPDECGPVRCGDSGPEIRFPFWLKDRQPNSCGYPGFELTCSRINDTRFELQFPLRASTRNLTNIVLPLSVLASVLEIDYKSQLIQLAVLNSSCLPNQLPGVKNSSLSLTSPFESGYSYQNNYTLLNCSSKYTDQNLVHGNLLSCLSGHGYDVFSFSSFSRISDFPLTSCMKMYDIFDVAAEALFVQFPEYGANQVSLRWSKPSCGVCETQGKFCRLEKNSTTGQETYCFGINGMPEQPPQKRRKGISRTGLVTGLAVSLSLILVTVGFICLWRKKEDRKKLETFMKDYKAHNPTRLSFADIKKMTSQFREKLGQGSYGTTYKGKLVNGSIVAVKVLNSSGSNSEEFISQLAKMGGIQHVNVVRFIGYCADGNTRALVYEFLPNGSLEEVILSGKQNNKPLDWEELQQIALGLAQGIDYLHHGCNQQVLHLDIKQPNVVLDHNYNARLTDYGIPKLCFKEQIAAMEAEQAAVEYAAPEVLSSSFENATCKSDVYSFGILLFEMVRRKGIHSNVAEASSRVYLPEWMYNQIQMEGSEEEDSKIKGKLIVVGLWCTQWHPSNRPSMKAVIQMLQGEDMPVLPPNSFAPTESKQPHLQQILV